MLVFDPILCLIANAFHIFWKSPGDFNQILLILLIIKDTEKYYLGRLLLWNYKAQKDDFWIWHKQNIGE